MYYKTLCPSSLSLSVIWQIIHVDSTHFSAYSTIVSKLLNTVGEKQRYQLYGCELMKPNLEGPLHCPLTLDLDHFTHLHSQRTVCIISLLNLSSHSQLIPFYYLPETMEMIRKELSLLPILKCTKSLCICAHNPAFPP